MILENASKWFYEILRDDLRGGRAFYFASCANEQTQSQNSKCKTESCRNAIKKIHGCKTKTQNRRNTCKKTDSHKTKTIGDAHEKAG